MRNRFFRPFWSQDVVAAERWLNRMSLGGRRLCGLDWGRRIFLFESVPPEERIHRIIRCEKGAALPPELSADGWETAAQSGRWRVLRHGTAPLPTQAPSAEAVRERNRVRAYAVGIVLLCMVILLLPIVLPIVLLTTLLADALSAGGGVSAVLPVAPVIYLLVLVLLLVSFIRLLHGNRKLRALSGAAFSAPVNAAGIPVTGPDGVPLPLVGRRVTKHPLGWFYTPEKTARWLEDMERRGLNLTKIERTGLTFRFVRGVPRCVKYVVDYPAYESAEYLSRYAGAGWQLVYRPVFGIRPQHVWAHLLPEGAAEPAFYPDAETELRRAHRFAATYSLFLLITAAIWAAMGTFDLIMAMKNRDGLVFSLFGVLFSVVVVEFSVFASRTIRNYFRVKKRLQDAGVYVVGRF